MWHVWEREDVSTGYWWVNLKARDHSEDAEDDTIILKWILKK
jgi:hypothetical protein